MGKFSPPDPFDFGKPQLWPDWKQRWLRYHTATELGKKAQDVQISSLIYAMGQKAEGVYNTFQPGAAAQTHATVLEQFDHYVVPRVNVIHERAKFHQRLQKPDESAEAFIRALFEIAQLCDFGENKDERVRDQLVVGTSDKTTSEKLQLEEQLTLERAIEICRTREQVKSQMAAQSASSSLDFVKKNAQRRPHKEKSKKNPSASSEKCRNCGIDHAGRDCPAKGKKCLKCKKTGHFRAVCRSKQKATNEVEEDVAADETSFYLGAIDCGEVKPWTVPLTINSHRIAFKADSGADIGCIPESDYLQLKPRPSLKSIQFPLTSPGGKVNCLGQFDAKTVYKGTKYTFPVCVLKQSHSRLLSRSAAAGMGILRFVEEVRPDVFGDFGLMKGEPVRIRLKPDAQPYNLGTPRRISAPLLSPLKKELERMVQNKIISPVTYPTAWCAPIVVVMKPNGKLRICVDYKKLNKSVMRELFLMPTVDEIASRLAGSTVFSALDCSSSFWQLPIHPEDRPLTCFITAFGRYVMNRLPFGLNSSTEILQRRLTEMFEGIPGVIIDVDDILIHAPTVEEHDRILEDVLKRIYESGLKLNKKKCKFRQSTIKYLGQVFSADGMKPDPEKVDAIKQLAPPKNVTEVRRFCGMVNYLGRYTPNLSSMLQPVHDLMKSDVEFVWDAPQQEAFDQVKKLLSSDTILKFYDMSKPTCVSADASGYGLGACLMQEHDGQLHPVAFASRSLTPTEKRWAQIEKECLALVWACEKFSHYLNGLPTFRLITDHKPLVPLINTKDLDKTPIRVQRLLIRLMRFNGVCEHVPGKALVVADALSRCNFLSQPHAQEVTVDDVETFVEDATRTWPVSSQNLKEIALETTKCSDMSLVYRHTQEGWPEYAKDVPAALKSYFASRNCLSTVNGIVTYLNRIVIPASLRKDTLARLHAGHQGVNKSRELAATTVWWPTINADISDTCKTCQFCEEYRPSKAHEPLMPTPLPEGPWQKLGADICEYNKQQYLVVVDYYSRFIELLHLPDLTSKTLVYKFKNLFARHGLPYSLRTDNARSFNSEEFLKFTQEHDIDHEFSSPHFSQSNGAAESAVKIAKKCLKQEDPFLALLMHRSTPHSATGVSPAELLYGRKIRSQVPVLASQLKPAWPDASRVREHDANYKKITAHHYNKRHGVRVSPTFEPQQNVRIKIDSEKEWKPATITSTHEKPRSYMVTTDNGKILRRNAKHIMPSQRTGCPSVAPRLAEKDKTYAQALMQPRAVTPKPAPVPPTTEVQPTPTFSPRKTRSGRVVKAPEKLDL